MLGNDMLDEVDGCEFGDARLNGRLHRIVSRFAEKPNMSIPSACLGRAETEAAYRFFDNKKVSSDEIFEAHARSTLRRIRQVKTVLLVQDTTKINLTRPGSEVEGVGPLGCETQLGALYHPLIAYEPSGLPLGTVWNRRWVRKGIHPGGVEEKHQARKCLPIEEKESFRWLEGLRQARDVAQQCPDTLCACVGDSESDIYEMFMNHARQNTGRFTC